MKKVTQLIHHSYKPPESFESPQPGIFKASTVYFPSAQAVRELTWLDKSSYTYGLHGTPTTFILEERIASLEGGRYCSLACSGLAAINLVNLALLKTGDQLLLPENVYEPSVEAADSLFKGFGVTTAYYDPMQPQTLKNAMTEKAKLVWLEAPGSVTMEFPALDELIKIARAGGAYTALDNTWSSGLAFCGFELGQDAQGQIIGADIVMQALTKYPSGGGDVLMGSVVTRDAAIHRQIQKAHALIGMGVAANDVELVLRSLPTLALRYHKQFKQAFELAQWCQERDEFAAVLNPALQASPGHDEWLRLSHKTGAGIFSVVFDRRFSQAQIDRFVDALKLFKIGYSWGGPVSLVMAYDLPHMRKHPHWDGMLVRFCIGFEDVQDLKDDLAQALKVM